MNLGLLVVVAVAALLPSFSESRIVSRCELRDKLQKMIRLPRRLEEGILATVICEVDRRSHLNSSSVSVFGNRITTTPKPTVITAPSTTGASKVTTATTNQPITVSSSTTQLTNTTTSTTTIPATTKSTISSVNTNLMSHNKGDKRPRQKREADSSSEFNEEGMVHYDSHMEDEDETSTEDDSGYIMKPWSLGLYGLFQLSDKHFCDSGYRWSRNVCCTSCTAFADDDITDDIACVVKTGHWREILGSASHSCRHTSNFFNECN